jgi:hypothetical protein
VARKFAITH